VSAEIDSDAAPHGEGDAWFLEGYAGPGGALVRTPIAASPFVVGRGAGLDLTLPSPEISQRHAELVRTAEGLELRDLGSTNGTFVNRRRLAGAAPLADGDVVHFASVELRLVRERRSEAPAPRGTVRIETLDLPRRFAGFRDELRALLDGGAIEPRFEPIVRLADGTAIAWEALARGAAADLPVAPARLFELAAEAGLAAELSRLCRRRALEAAPAALPAGAALFLNCHPAELADPGPLIDSLAELRAAGDRPLVLEIHEASITDPASIAGLRRRLDPLAVGIAYDDFGAGQARLVELAESPPDHLKFDRSLVSGLDRAGDSRWRVLGALVAMARDLEIPTIAEGIETDAELDACRGLGFTAGQGHVFL
jgi:EAL domain-containing protein (putative c-di-GMP-specific phosphodiesterase class I)